MKTLALILMCFLIASQFFTKTALAAMKVASKKVSISGKLDVATVQDLKKWSDLEETSCPALCAEVVEIPHSYICSFKTKTEMNNTLLRMGFFTGTADGYVKGTLVSNSESALNMYKKVVGGHTLTSDDIIAFRLAANASSNTSSKLNDQESDFYSNIITNISSQSTDSKYAIIAFANDASNYEVIVGHEINHASFYLQPTYKKAAKQFWQNKVSHEDKIKIRSILSKIYNAKDDNIIVDEFQAYLTQLDEKNNPLAKFIPKYKQKLMKNLGL
ncbi:MAG: hypothetical protein JNL11_03520 [Bdellovibrionaceae bacterium]|nr:hypothetical protein [Pseudobdellovibrionaceae bacterium]